MVNIVRSIIAAWAILLLATPLHAEQPTRLSAQQRLQKGQSADDALTKALRAQGYTVNRVGHAGLTPLIKWPKGLQCTQTCTFLPPICTVSCHLI
jgi:hypothetical protein